MALKNRSIIYWLKVFIVTSAVCVSITFSFLDITPPCLYCQLSRASFIALLLFYIIVNTKVMSNSLGKFALRYEAMLEFIFVIFCFLAGLLALFSKYGLLANYFPTCGNDELSCSVSYELFGLIDLKTLSFLGGLSILLLKCVESFLGK
jgi:hypothetical protein